MCFRFTKTSGRGIPPDPRNDIPRAKSRPSDTVCPQKAEAEGMDGTAHHVHQRQASKEPR